MLLSSREHVQRARATAGEEDSRQDLPRDSAWIRELDGGVVNGKRDTRERHVREILAVIKGRWSSVADTRRVYTPELGFGSDVSRLTRALPSYPQLTRIVKGQFVETNRDSIWSSLAYRAKNG